MVPHRLHLVQSPSGISRFLGLFEASLGFFMKLVLPVTGGGVTAGSIVSRPRVFFVNEVVAMLSQVFIFRERLSRHKLRRPQPGAAPRRRRW